MRSAIRNNFCLRLTKIGAAGNAPNPTVADMNKHNDQIAAFTVPTQRCVDAATDLDKLEVAPAPEPSHSMHSVQAKSASRCHRLVHEAQRAYRHSRSSVARFFFDRRYGVHTEELVELDSLGIDTDQRCGYMPYGWRSLARILPPAEVSPRDVFLDAGSGMGRVVLQAALHYPFHRVIGVEIAEYFHQVSTSNLARNRNRLRCSDVVLVRSDILDYTIPDDVTVVFMFNPFDGEVFADFIQHLLDSIDRRPRTVRLIYGNPREETALLATGRIQRVRSLRGLRPSHDWSRSNSTRMYLITPAPRDAGLLAARPSDNAEPDVATVPAPRSRTWWRDCTTTESVR